MDSSSINTEFNTDAGGEANTAGPTPGPWRMVDTTNEMYSGYCGEISIVSDHGQPTSQGSSQNGTPYYGGGLLICEGFNGGVLNEEIAAANALRIVTAVNAHDDLVAALEGCLRCFSDQQTTGRYTVPPREDAPTVVNARAALAKAKRAATDDRALTLAEFAETPEAAANAATWKSLPDRGNRDGSARLPKGGESK